MARSTGSHALPVGWDEPARFGYFRGYFFLEHQYISTLPQDITSPPKNGGLVFIVHRQLSLLDCPTNMRVQLLHSHACS